MTGLDRDGSQCIQNTVTSTVLYVHAGGDNSNSMFLFNIKYSQPIGISEGVWFGQSAINRRTLRQFAITVDAYCLNQIVPVFEDRPIRNDNTQCSQHFTNQQYEFDPASGNVTVEWEGTGPDATVQVSQFMCILPNTGIFSCISPLVITGLSPGNHTLSSHQWESVDIQGWSLRAYS
ncbi:uncharacterized protein LOC135340081 [Halichondria panicea]|uniref:uncharacterized protein LOC135340081 n=1 Tax=Halichondria panicea TaxID=6063 RepID=UPI00312B73DF